MQEFLKQHLFQESLHLLRVATQLYPERSKYQVLGVWAVLLGVGLIIFKCNL